MKKILLLVFISLLTFTHAQKKYNVVEHEATKSKTRGSLFIGIDDNGYIYTQSFKATYIVVGMLLRPYLKVFDASTGEVHAEVPLKNSPELKSRGLEYIAMGFIDQKPTIICSQKNAKTSKKFYGVRVDQNGRLEGDEFEIGSAAECSGLLNKNKSVYNGVEYQKTEKGTFTFISDVSCGKDELKSYHVLQLDKNMEVENTFSFKLDFEIVRNLKISEKGNYLYLKVDTKEKEKVDGKLLKRWKTTPRLFKINRKNGDLQEIKVQESFDPVKIGDFITKAVSNGVLISGQIIHEKGFAGIFTAILDDETGEITDIQIEDFDSDFVTKYWTQKQKDKQERKRNKKGESLEDENFSTDFQFMEAYETRDNGLISIFQEFELKVITRTSTDANGVTTTTTDYYYYYKDVIVVKTKEDGSIEYTKLLPFYQLTVNYDPGIGYASLRDKNDIYFLHGTSNIMEEMIEEGAKSERKSKRKDRAIKYASVTRLNESGKVSTEQVLDLRERDVSIDPNVVGVDEKNQQFVIVSPVMKMFNYKKTKVIRIEL